jgi:hypothetical protein
VNTTVARKAGTGNGETFLPDNYVINIIRRAVANEQSVRINAPSAGRILVLPKLGEYIGSWTDAERFFTTGASQFDVTVVDDGRGTLPNSSEPGRNIDELMWMAGFYASSGRLMDGCFLHDVVQFRHWPNLTRLPITANTMRIIALLAQRATSISLVRRVLDVSLEEVSQIYSAARCAGIAHVVNRKADEPTLKPHRNQALLGLILNKIAGL